MFNGFNGQQHGNYAAWQMSYGNLQGNFSATTVQNSFGQAHGFQGPHDPYAHYGSHQQQPGWQQPPDLAMAYHYQQQQQQQQQAMAQQQYHYQYYQCPSSHPEPLPPLPNGAPPPLPPTPSEEPPPLPLDAGPAPLPPQPEAQPPGQQSHPPQPQPQLGHSFAGVAAPDAQGPVAGQFQQPGNASGQALTQTNTAAWAQHVHHQHALQQAPYHHMGHGGPTSYPSFPHQPPQPPAHQHGGFGQHPPHSLHHPSSLPPGQQQQPQAAPPGPPYAAGSGLGSHPLQLQAAGAVPHAAASAAPSPSAPAPLAPVVVDITRLLGPPHRATRPRKLLLVLRGLPGSGKSTLARKIREAELEAGAEAPRLHSMDDYYMQEVEVEVVEEEGGRKKRRKVTELKYVYEPEMEGTYFRDLVRAVGRSCEDRRHSFVVVDAPVLRAEQLRELMAVGQRANFECFALLPLETDPALCGESGRNVHGHSAEALRDMAAKFEPAPPLYAQVSAVSLFGGPVVGEEEEKESAKSRARSGGEIQEVEMDMEDSDDEGAGEGDDASDDGSQRRRPTSRWHDDDGRTDGGADGWERHQRRKAKRDKAKMRAVADIDERGILLGLNDALAAAPDGAGGAAAAAAAAATGCAKRALRPLRSALRRSQSAPAPSVAVSATAAAAGGGGGSGAVSQRRVWWPDLGQGPTAADAAAEAEQSADVAATSAQVKLVEVVYLEGLGPPAELEDLPYGYQRRSAVTARPEAGAAAGGVVGGAGESGAAGAASAGGGVAVQRRFGPSPHGSFRDQAKAEHESEHDLFRRLLLGKQAGGAAGGPGGSVGSQPLGLFAAPADEDEDEAA